MSEQQPRSNQGPSRDSTNDPSHPRTSSLPASLLPYLQQGPSLSPDEEPESQPTLPFPNYVPTHQPLPSLPSLSLNSQQRITGESASTRRVLPSLQEGATFPSGPRSTSASSASADYNAPARSRASDVPAAPRSLSHTSLPRYSAVPSAVFYSEYANDAQYTNESASTPHEGRYEATPAMSALHAHRSYTFPATSHERAHLHQGHAAAENTRTPGQPFLRGPGLGTPPSSRRAFATTPPAPHFQPQQQEGQAQAQRIPGQRYSQAPLSVSPRSSLSAPSLTNSPNFSGIARHVGAVVSSEPAAGLLAPSATSSAPITNRERRGSNEGDSLRRQYAYPLEAQYLPSRVSQLSHELPASIGSSSTTKHTRSASIEHPDITSAAPSTSGAVSSSTSAQIAGSATGRERRGGAGRGRGRGRGKKAGILASASASASKADTQTFANPPVFWGREQRIAHAAEVDLAPSGQPSTSASMLAPAPQNMTEASIQSQALRTPGATRLEQAVTGPPGTSRSLAKKGKERDEASIAGDMRDAEANVEEDELEETTDDEGQPRFSIGSAPSRSGSAGGSHAVRTKTKIEVACDFCRKRKMKCDGDRPTCRNCQRKNVACSYIPIVRRRGPGKKQKVIDARPKKTNKKIESDKKQGRGKGKAKASQSGEVPTQGPQEGDLPQSLETPPPQASGSSLRLESPTQHFPSEFQQATSELYMLSPLQNLSSPRPGGPSTSFSGATVSPFSSATLPLPLYSPDHLPLYGHSAPFGGELFLPGHSPTMSIRDVVDPYAGVDIGFHEASDSTQSNVGPQDSESSTMRTASVLSSGPSSSEGEPGRHSRRRRTAKRSRTERERRGRELEEGEIDEASPSSGTQGYEQGEVWDDVGDGGNQRLRR